MTRLVHSGTEGPDAAPRCLTCEPREDCGVFGCEKYGGCERCRPECFFETVRSCRECDTPRYDTRQEEALDK